MAKSTSSGKPSKGGTVKKNLWIVNHPVKFGIYLVVAICSLLLLYFRTGIFFMLAFCAGMGALVVYASGKESLKERAKSRHMLWQVPVLSVTMVFGLIVAQPLGIWVGELMTRDWGRWMNPPAVYYIWKVNASVFKDKAGELAVLNPAEDDNEAFKSSVLLAAHAVGLKADVLEPFDPTVLDEDEAFTVVVFESKVTKGQVPNPKAAEKNEPETIEGDIPQLRVFVFHVPPKPDEEEQNRRKKAFKKPKPVKMEDSLDLDLSTLIESFSHATGNPVDRETVEGVLREQEAAQSTNGS